MDKEERSWTIWQPPVLLVRSKILGPAEGNDDDNDDGHCVLWIAARCETSFQFLRLRERHRMQRGRSALGILYNHVMVIANFK